MDIDKAMRRPWRYWYEDGLTEIASGSLLLVIAALLLAQGFLMRWPPLGCLPAFLLPVVVIGGTLLARRVLGAVKERLVYPRTGYVAYRRAKGSRRLRRAILGGVTGATMPILLALGPAMHAWIPALEGLLFAGLYLYMGARLDLMRFYALGMLAALAGIVASLAGLGDTLGSAALFGAAGAGLLVSGAVALCQYLRRSRPLAEDEGHGR